MPTAEFVAFLSDQLAPLGRVHARRMFGGWGLYLDGAIFAIVVDDVAWLKADALNQAEFERRDMPRFEYARNGRNVSMGFHRLPDTALDERDELLQLARSALGAALRTRAGAKR